MKQVAARILLVCFALSVVLFPMIELTHIVLHTFNNPFHSHASGVKRAHHYHTIADHNLKQKEKDGGTADTEQTGFVAFLFGVSTPLVTLDPTGIGESVQQIYFERPDLFISWKQVPPTPPPCQA